MMRLQVAGPCITRPPRPQKFEHTPLAGATTIMRPQSAMSNKENGHSPGGSGVSTHICSLCSPDCFLTRHAVQLFAAFFAKSSFFLRFFSYPLFLLRYDLMCRIVSRLVYPSQGTVSWNRSQPGREPRKPRPVKNSPSAASISIEAARTSRCFASAFCSFL